MVVGRGVDQSEVSIERSFLCSADCCSLVCSMGRPLSSGGMSSRCRRGFELQLFTSGNRVEEHSGTVFSSLVLMVAVMKQAFSDSESEIRI